MSDEKAKVKYRLFWRFQLTADSPFCVSNGDSTKTDNDIIRTADNEPFIPGSSVAGAFLHCTRNDLTEDQKLVMARLFGVPETGTRSNITDDSFRMSRLFFSDIVFRNARITSRDGIRLDKEKTAMKGDKCNYQICEMGASGFLRIECVLYESDNIESLADVNNIISGLVFAINAGELRFGFKKTRGLGKFVCDKSYGYRCFDFSGTNRKEVMHEYIDFCRAFPDGAQYDKCSLDKAKGFDKSAVYCSINIPLELMGGISIRTYSAQPDAPDYSHLTTGIDNNEFPVVPGTSWNGAIRSHCFNILSDIMDAREFDDKQKKQLIGELNALWGILPGTHSYRQSSFVFSESVIQRSNKLEITRNAINRFDASTKTRALYNESAYFQGTTTLTIDLVNANGMWAMYLIWLAIRDLCCGLLAVGGLTSVGRGIFSNTAPCFEKELQARDALEAKLSEVKGGIVQ